MSEITELFNYLLQRYMEADPSTKFILAVGVINILVAIIACSISIALELSEAFFNH